MSPYLLNNPRTFVIVCQTKEAQSTRAEEYDDFAKMHKTPPHPTSILYMTQNHLMIEI